MLPIWRTIFKLGTFGLLELLSGFWVEAGDTLINSNDDQKLGQLDVVKLHQFEEAEPDFHRFP